MPLPRVVNDRAGPILALAPMATLSHAALRSLINEFGGCDLYFSEMISAEASIGGTPFEGFYHQTAPDPQRLLFQLTGRSEATIVEAARHCARLPCAGIDLNFGCCAPRIRKAGAGFAWTADHDRAARLVDRVRAAVPADRTVSVKLRLGDGEEPEETLRLAHRLADAGAGFLTLHPRRSNESYSRPARWPLMGAFARELALPLLGNGDVKTPPDLHRALASGVAGLMVGRGAVARPWLFSWARSTVADLPAGSVEPLVDLRATALRFHDLLRRWQPREFLHSRARRFHHYFLATLPFGGRLAAQIQGLPDFDTIERCVDDYFARYPRYQYNHSSRYDGAQDGERRQQYA